MKKRYAVLQAAHNLRVACAQEPNANAINISIKRLLGLVFDSLRAVELGRARTAYIELDPWPVLKQLKEECPAGAREEFKTLMYIVLDIREDIEKRAFPN